MTLSLLELLIAAKNDTCADDEDFYDAQSSVRELSNDDEIHESVPGTQLGTRCHHNMASRNQPEVGPIPHRIFTNRKNLISLNSIKEESGNLATIEEELCAPHNMGVEVNKNNAVIHVDVAFQHETRNEITNCYEPYTIRNLDESRDSIESDNSDEGTSRDVAPRDTEQLELYITD